MPTEAISAERPVTYDELKRHASYDDAWIAINGTVYDITHFLPDHPAGDTFRGNLGAECGGLFSASHVNTNVEALLKRPEFLVRHRIAVVGRLTMADNACRADSDNPYLDRIVYKDTAYDPFWLELKSEVRAHLRKHSLTTSYTAWEGVGYVVYYLAIFGVLSYLTWVEGWILAAIVLGIHMICALSNIAHMATHFGFTRNHPLNVIAVHLFDLSGISGLEWQITHQTHHNQPHSSIDHQTNVYGWIGARIHKYVRHRPYHRFQPFYFWLTVSMYLPYKFFSTTYWLIENRQFVRHWYEWAAHICGRAVMIALAAYCGLTLGWGTAALMTALYFIAYSQTAYILLFNDYEDTHAVLGEKEDVDGFHNRLSWAEVQVRTSNNWYPTNWLMAFIEFHYGYFNYHIEHHLFPSLKPTVLKKISPVVRRVCQKHGVPYISTPFLTVQQSLQRHLIKMSRPA